jgi:hypothetical protein
MRVQGRIEAIAEICEALRRGNEGDAKQILRTKYPFAPNTPTRHSPGPVQSTRVFLRDGFIDRYTGDPLVFPPVLRALSILMPSDFPFHPNWKTDVTHAAYWEIGATVDHVAPRSRGGSAQDENLVTTSMARNMAKSHWTLEELGWELHPPGRLCDWDGLVSWFLDFARQHQHVLAASDVRRWHKAAVQLCSGG